MKPSVLCVFLALLAVPAWGENFGSFLGKVVASWDDDGRMMTLVEPFAYLDPTGQRWDAPIGSRVDGASIPKFAWSIIGGPFEGKYRAASVIHDVACVEQRRPWQDVHLAFYTGMLASGVDLKLAKVMYAAVYHFGPRWQRFVIVENVPIDSWGSEAASIVSTARKGESAFVPLMSVKPNPDPRGGPPSTIDFWVAFKPNHSSLSQEDFESLKQLIEQQDLTPDAIENFRSEKAPQ